MNLAKTLGNIRDRIKKEGIRKASLDACKAGGQRARVLPVRFRKQYNLKNELPKRIEKVKEELHNHPGQFFQRVQEATLSYIRSNHKSAIGPGTYSYKPGGPPILYASCYAALTRHLYSDLDDLCDSDRKGWIAYLQSFQTRGGLFRDPIIDIPLAEGIDWWGWRHLTLHVLMAFTSLGGVADRAFAFLEPFRKKGFMTEWLTLRNWKIDPTSVSNEVQNYATALQYARDFQQENWCGDALQEMYNWLDNTQDPKTGLWGARFDDPMLLSNGVQTAYHLWLLYFYDNRPIQYIERIIDSCLTAQNRFGGFGVSLNSSACEDIDSIDPLIRLSLVTDYRRTDIIAALKRALPWILVNMNSDGGWVFRRYEAHQYGHPEMSAEIEESAMFPTWFRTLTLAYLAQALGSLLMPTDDWKWLKTPGHQFWINHDRQ